MGMKPFSFCGGSIYNKRTIITAAHCLKPEETNLQIAAGEFNIDQNDGHEQVKRVVIQIRHPSYDSKTFDNDVALLILGNCFLFSFINIIPTETDKKKLPYRKYLYHLTIFVLVPTSTPFSEGRFYIFNLFVQPVLADRYNNCQKL